jgi:hypothetical protein
MTARHAADRKGPIGEGRVAGRLLAEILTALVAVVAIQNSPKRGGDHRSGHNGHFSVDYWD